MKDAKDVEVARWKAIEGSASDSTPLSCWPWCPAPSAGAAPVARLQVDLGRSLPSAWRPREESEFERRSASERGRAAEH